MHAGADLVLAGTDATRVGTPPIWPSTAPAAGPSPYPTSFYVAGVLGQIASEPWAHSGILNQQSGVGHCTIARVRSRAGFRFERLWLHVRENSVDLTLFCFCRRGTVRFDAAGAGTDRSPVRAFTVRAMRPFAIDAITEDGVCELLFLATPTHHLRTIHDGPLPESGYCARHESLRRLVEQILVELLSDSTALSPQACRHLLESAIRLAIESLAEAPPAVSPSRSMAGHHLSKVLHYIDLHLSDPALCTASVARACGISQRYLAKILKRHRKPFSQFVWEARLQAAANWLRTTHGANVSISEVAYRTGFKSPAHFSRRFKRHFNVTPSDCRAVGTARADS
jgi:AraC family transcriptional regulator, positive regulator of tynA and feaB